MAAASARIYALLHWDDATAEDVEAIRAQARLLDMGEAFVAALVDAVWALSADPRNAGQVRRVLLAVTSAAERELLFGAHQSRGPTAYLKLRFYDRAPAGAIAAADAAGGGVGPEPSAYYATLGLLITAARPPLQWFTRLVNEFTGQPVLYR